MNMTDEQIKHALEYCKNIQCNSQCPNYFEGSADVLECRKIAIQNALNYINRLETENENYSHNIKNLTAENMRLQENVTRLQNILLAFMDEVAKWESKKGIDVSDLPLIPIRDERRNIIDHYRTQAVKEFAERLKEKKMQSTMDRRICTFEMIDNILKEMEGEG